jgi:hypothetical protein
MKVDKLTLERLFDHEERMEAPLFQRPYVWQKERNWVPLWESVQIVAEKRLAKQDGRPHFLGTIVLDQLKTSTGQVHARQIIDGQQRLTTLQLALAAARDLCSEMGQAKYAQAFGKLVRNDLPLSVDPDEQFKAWPTNADRDDFREVMLAGSVAAVRGLPHSNPDDEWLIPDAYLYFADAFAAWLGPADGASFVERLDTLYHTLREDLHVVVIDLEATDDAQIIFETLNARGTPLLPADLVKNYLFHLAVHQKLDTKKLYDQYWQVFDTDKDYWREEVRQGRLSRARIDLFLYHYLGTMVGDDIAAANLYGAYRDFVKSTNGECAAKHMELFRTYADVYRKFESYPDDTREGLFFYRLRQMDTTTVYPLLLELLRRNADGSGEELGTILSDLESFLVRRVVCELTPKNYNRFFVDMTKELRKKDDFSAEAVRGFLLAQTSEVSRWPDDKELEVAWGTINIYKRLKKPRTRMILEALEAGLHTNKTERVPLDKLTIEHLMPREWEKHWPIVAGDGAEASAEKRSRFRNEMIHKIGNLTLLTKALNPAVSNGPWGEKRPEILRYSALNLNRELPEEWNEVKVYERSMRLFTVAAQVWPRPAK